MMFGVVPNVNILLEYSKIKNINRKWHHGRCQKEKLNSRDIQTIFANLLPLLFIVLVVAVPVEFIKNYYFVDYGESNYSTFRRDGVVGLLFLSVITPIVIHFVYNKEIGSSVTLMSSFIVGLKKWPRIILYGFVKNVVIFAGLIFFIIPGIIFYFRLTFLDIVITVEGTKGKDPFGRSKMISMGHLKPIILNSVILTLILVLPISLLIFIIYSIDAYWLGDTLVDVIFDLTSVLYLILGLKIYMRITNSKD